mmetsp:Transcript_65305/g.206289  ORF Transcript_65305/g.206289 Transcript_65305/m.206289 type:complete len:137 (-) Transcript_65305:16-426(-)
MEAYLREELRQYKQAAKIKFISRLGYIGVGISWAAFCYWIFVYSVKMFKYVGKGSETAFLTGWLEYMIIDNLVFSWADALRNAAVIQMILHLGGILRTLISPTVWFETYDDTSTTEALHEEISPGVDTSDLDEVDF